MHRRCKTPSPCLPEQIRDPLPDKLREEYHLCTLRYALETIHFPKTPEELTTARFRLTFEEFLVLQLGLLRIKSGRKGENLHPIPKAFPEGYTQLLPFQLTGAQRRAITESVEDMAGPSPMNRLVQGDVGSGKTAVAAALCWAVIQSGMQAALMAPTEILAAQHYHSLNALLEPAHITCALLTGSVKAAERKRSTRPSATGASSWSLAPTPSSATRWNFKTWAWSSPTSSTGLGWGSGRLWPRRVLPPTCW